MRQFQLDALVRKHRGELLEVGPVPRLLRIQAVHRLDPEEGVVFLVVLGRADLAEHLVPDPKAEPLDLGGGHVNVLGARQVAAGPQEAVPFLHDLEDARAEQQPALLGL